MKITIPGRKRQTETSYKKTLTSSRWMMEETKTTLIAVSNNKISITGGSKRPETNLLSRCLVGKFQLLPKETPTLNDVRKWACNSWKSTFGINVFNMNDSQFLFELPTRKAAEHVMTGQMALGEE